MIGAKGAALVVAPVVAVGVLVAGVLVAFGGVDTSSLTATDCTIAADLPDLGPAAASGTLSAEQMANATTIVQVGASLGVPAKGLVVALATALQESGLRNLTFGDLDSVGLFQQRAAWGSYTDRTTPAASARMFFTGGAAGQRGLLDVPGWEAMPVWQAAQATQVSAFPTAYAKWTATATTAVDTILATGTITTAQPIDLSAADPTQAACTTQAGVTDPGAPLPTPNTATAQAAITYAMAQVGKWYQWGGTGNPSYDCSGLVQAAYRSAGIALPRTAEDQIDAGAPVPDDQLEPGDLLFFNPGEQIAGRPGHVGIYLGNGLMVDAPRTGKQIRVEAYATFGQYIGARRVTGA